MALTPAPMSANQTAYLNNLVKVGGGNAEWAKGQLTAAPTPPKPILGGLTPAQLSAMGEGIKSLGTNFGTAAPTQTATPKEGGGFNVPSYAGDSVPDAPVTPAPMQTATQSTPAPSQGSFPGQLTAAQIKAEAQARIDKQHTAITSATNAANAARKNVFDYTNQITGDSRTLENGAFNETHNPFTGQTGYAQANLQRNRGIQDTANNNAYQADITANNQKLTDFETLAPEQQQTILNDLTRQERDYGLQVGTLTGQFNGQATLAKQGQDAQYTGVYNGMPTMQAQNQGFNQGIAQAGVTGQYNGSPTLAASQQGFQDRLAYGNATGTFGNGQKTTQQQQIDMQKDPNSIDNQLKSAQASYYKDHGQYYAGGGSSSGGGSSASKTAVTNSYTGTVYDNLSQLDPSDYQGYLEANQGEIVSNIGQKGYDDLKKSVLSDQNAQAKADTAQGKADTTLRSQAIAAAQKDPDWKYATADEKKALIKQYEGFHQ